MNENNNKQRRLDDDDDDDQNGNYNARITTTRVSRQPSIHLNSSLYLALSLFLACFLFRHTRKLTKSILISINICNSLCYEQNFH